MLHVALITVTTATATTRRSAITPTRALRDGADAVCTVGRKATTPTNAITVSATTSHIVDRQPAYWASTSPTGTPTTTPADMPPVIIPSARPRRSGPARPAAAATDIGM